MSPPTNVLIVPVLGGCTLHTLSYTLLRGEINEVLLVHTGGEILTPRTAASSKR